MDSSRRWVASTFGGGILLKSGAAWIILPWVYELATPPAAPLRGRKLLQALMRRIFKSRV